METERIAPVTAGEMLVEEFMKPQGLTAHALAAATGLKEVCLSEIIDGTRRITDEIDAALCSHFGLSPGWWSRLQGIKDASSGGPASFEKQ